MLARKKTPELTAQQIEASNADILAMRALMRPQPKVSWIKRWWRRARA